MAPAQPHLYDLAPSQDPELVFLSLPRAAADDPSPAVADGAPQILQAHPPVMAQGQRYEHRGATGGSHCPDNTRDLISSCCSYLPGTNGTNPYRPATGQLPVACSA